MAKQNKKKKNGWKITLIVLGSILLVILLIFAIFAILNKISVKASMELAASFSTVENPDAVVPTQDENGNWSFTTDRDLKVLQLTDIHLGAGCLSTKQDTMAINAVASMVTAEKPDLVVITGDIAFPVPFISGTINNKNAAKIFSTLMEKLGVPWIPVFGNHDTEVYSVASREEMGDFYESDALKHCLFRKGDADVDGFGNSIIEVKNTDGIITQALYLIDSHAYVSKDALGILWKYDHIHDNQINWYKNSLSAINKKNAVRLQELYGNDAEALEKATAQYGDVTSMLFFHVPPIEYRDAWEEYVANGSKDTENVQLHYGTVGEIGAKLCCPIEDDMLFETMQTMGGKKGIFCGHDHLNTFSLDYKDIRLTYGYSIDYLAYSGISKIGTQRGCTIITLGTDGNFDCIGSNYYQDKYQILSGGVKESVTMQDLDEYAKQ